MPYTGPDRKRTRINWHDYRLPGPYFVTIVTHHRACLFGHISNGTTHPTPAGDMIHNAWLETAGRYPETAVTPVIVMPNHIHGVIRLPELTGPDQPSLSEIIDWFKTVTTKRFISGVRMEGWPPFDGHVWQHSFHDHIIRSPHDYERISTYIQTNPSRWNEDTYHEPDTFAPIATRLPQ